MIEPTSLYVHIPFCAHICAYCDFCKVYYYEPWVDQYLDWLEKELIWRKANRPFDTVYIGGGTPSCLNLEQLQRLMSILKIPLSHAIEATIEANPDQLTANKIQIMKEGGINRISLGVQTFDENILKALGRQHTVKDVERAIASCHEQGLINVSFDLMYGLPGQTHQIILDDLKRSVALGVSHLSYYSLILEEHTLFAIHQQKEKEETWILEADRLIHSFLEKNGFEHYEISNYAKSGFRSKHNMVYWKNEGYVAIGVGASGYIGNVRYDNTRSINQYLRGITTKQEQILTIDDQIFESFMLNWRLKEGIHLDSFEKRFSKSAMDCFPEALNWMLEEGYIANDGKYLYCLPKGFAVLDELLLKLE